MKEIFDIRIERIHDERIELLDVRQRLAADLFLIGVRQSGNLRNGLFGRSGHGHSLARSALRAQKSGAGEGNRTLVCSLGSSSSLRDASDAGERALLNPGGLADDLRSNSRSLTAARRIRPECEVAFPTTLSKDSTSASVAMVAN